ncbi:fasciclin domain-containing protein [Halorarius litoreus]|uniref:fasciclin domain-containing protein n=1 Tax=Halorarius litoreus TaxID=2962676 RepID=UPI0020CD968D|nr:fasciclin domain-containing protein [Halorarius litoreus]
MIDSQRRQVLKAVGATGAILAAGGVGTAGARPGGRSDASAEDTIFDIASGSADFDILELALEETGLDEVLDSTDGQFTVFAPTDGAFAALLTELGITAAQLLADPDLEDILLYHVTAGRRYAASVVRAPQLRMLTGDTVTVDGTVLNGGEATIVDTPDTIDIEASNGVIHVIDGVLQLP